MKTNIIISYGLLILFFWVGNGLAQAKIFHKSHLSGDPAGPLSLQPLSFLQKGGSGSVRAANGFMGGILGTADGPGGSRSSLNMPNRALIAAALFAPTVLSGFALTNMGEPYNTWLVTGHKLAGVANMVLLNYTAWQANRIRPMDCGEWTATIFTNLCFVATIASGAVMTMDMDVPDWVRTTHRTTPWVTMASSALMLFLLVG